MSARPKPAEQAPGPKKRARKGQGPWGSTVVGPAGPPTTSREKEKAELSRACLEWNELLAKLGDASALWASTHGSRNPEPHRSRVVLGFAAGTTLRAIAAWRVWQEWADSCGAHAAAPLVRDLMDFFLESASASRSVRGSDRQLRDVRWLTGGLRWLAKHAQLEQFAKCMQDDTVCAYASKVLAPRDRREARPLPLAVLFAWQQRVLDTACPPQERLFLGGLLACTWASLRFGDAQRCMPMKVLTSHDKTHGDIVRGTCWRAKVSVSGQPWGLVAAGVATPGDPG